MDAGKMRDRIELLTLRESSAGFAWETAARVWSQARRVSGTNLFSKVGLGKPTIEFVMRKRVLTLHHAIRLDGKHCFLTDIIPAEDRLYMTVRAALAEPAFCTVERTKVSTDNALNRPVVSVKQVMTFPAVLTEKYVKATADIPQTVTEISYVLVTPKPTLLHVGELVTVGGEKYGVRTEHLLDEYKNEYEVLRREDA